MVDFKGYNLKIWYFPKSWPKGNPWETTPRLVLLLLKLNSEKQVWALKRNWIITRGWRSENDTWLWADAVLGLRGGLCRVAEGVCVDRGAGDWSLGCSRLELCNSGVMPSGCLIQVAANTRQVWTYLHLWHHGKLTDGKHEAHLASDLLYLYYQMCTCICTLEPNVTARATVAFDRRASWQAMCAHEWNWLKPHRLQNPLERFLFACNWLVRAPVLWGLTVFLLLLIRILFSSLKGGLWKDSGKKTKRSAYKTCQSCAIFFILSKIGKFTEVWLSLSK